MEKEDEQITNQHLAPEGNLKWLLMVLYGLPILLISLSINTLLASLKWKASLLNFPFSIEYKDDM